MSLLGAAVLLCAYALGAKAPTLPDVHDPEELALRAAIFGCGLVLVFYVIGRTRQWDTPPRDPACAAASVGLAAWFWMVPLLGLRLGLDGVASLWLDAAVYLGPDASVSRNLWLHPMLFQVLAASLGIVAVKQARTRRLRWIVAGWTFSAPAAAALLAFVYPNASTSLPVVAPDSRSRWAAAASAAG
jgi:hypothetical protein